MPLTPQGPGMYTTLPVFSTESSGLTGGRASGPTAVEVLRAFGNNSALNHAPSLITPMLTLTNTLDAGVNRFIAGMGMLVFPLATTTYNSFGMDLDGAPVTVNPLAPDTPSPFQTAGYRAQGFAFGIPLGDSAVDQPGSNLNVTIGRFGGAGNFDVFLSAYLFQFGNQADAASLTQQADSVLSLDTPPGAQTMDSTINAGDLIFTAGATSGAIGPPAPFSVQSPDAGGWNVGTQFVDVRATMKLSYRSDLSGLIQPLWNWSADAGNGSYGYQFVVRLAP